jgi:N-methylhydantoinase A/oxoprolinase/acetone carboxylase beta subunit
MAGTGVRVGVDVGGTFTKAVAVDAASGAVIARAVVPTTHADQRGVAAGVVSTVVDVARAVGSDRVDLVTHSTTQAVNALLEGDVGAVGVVGLGRRPDLKQARKRTQLDRIELSPGRFLRTVPEFMDVTDGVDEEAAEAAIARLRSAGATAVSVAEAFAPDDPTCEQRVAALADEAGLPACASSELTGLYGLELRAVTATLNASIIPIAARTAEVVADGVRAAGVGAPVMVMRGDGGATDLHGFRRAPARTLYSGPAASVAGALRFVGVSEGVVVEVGGTSTNVAAITRGRPALSYVQVASHSTALRAVDVRVVGVAGGSMLRARRGKVYGVGPRSAHIAGLGYACYRDPADFDGATVELVAPRTGDAADHVVIVLRGGERVALTNTCAANALGITHPGDYAYAPPDAAAAAFAIAGPELHLPGAEVARRILEASGTAVADLVYRVMREHHLTSPTLLAVGGGAGGLGRHVAAMLRLDCVVPDEAEVISSLGDALSLLRAERERTVSTVDAGVLRELARTVEAEVLASGAAPATIEVRIDEEPEKGTVRAVATGAVGLRAGAVPGRTSAGEAEVEASASAAHFGAVRPAGDYWLASADGRILVLDRFADPVVTVRGELVDPGAEGAVAAIDAAVGRQTRHRGPMTIPPTVWVIDGSHLIELSSSDAAATAAGYASVAAAVLVGRADT